MKVTLLNYAQSINNIIDLNHENLAKKAAAICVDKLDNPTEKGMMNAIDSGHLSIIEHLPLTFLVEDVSRALTHQLVRHRIASYSQQSQRYAKVNTDDYWFIIPKSWEKNHHLFTKYKKLMMDIADLYNEACEANIPNEDARFILPNACYTSIIVTMNARSFTEACSKRTCNKSQWEIRELFTEMRELIKDIYPNIYQLCFPDCWKKGGCKEIKPCI